MNMQDCIVYLEAFEKVGDGMVDAYIDFRQEKDLLLFTRAIGYEFDNATFIELKSLKSSKRLRSGCYYKLNLDLLKEYQIERREDSLVIGASYNLNEMSVPMVDDEELLQKHEALAQDDMSRANVPDGWVFEEDQGRKLTLYVKDVGQANWNELRVNGKIKVLYDAGARLHAKESEVRGILNSRKMELMYSKPVLVVSHWDMDHIHCLKVMADEDIKDCFSKIVCPNKLKSISSTELLERFKRVLGLENVFCLPLPRRTDGITLHQWKREGRISIYRGENSSQVNYCGLVMFVRGDNRSANFTGDCRLAQAENAYEQEMAHGLGTKEHILVAPHHGGDSGSRYRHYSNPCNLIEISVGANNSYGHPHGDMLKYLRLLGFVKQTKDVGDINEYL